MINVLTTSQVAERLAMTEDYVRRQCESGALRAVKLGNRWRITEAALEQFLAGNAPAAQPRAERLSARQRRRSA
ncbi:helix-turn-helix domain-containing protein [Mumia sp. DW29H23]|uniref:helix-turn-helix domain-containing protein n=1 Tax=Mumia sp. DW29H23 TaxID=3421241 RepID=UPI003D68BFC8